MVYEFTLKEAGTYMYHPHADEMLQMAMAMMGFFIVHPRDPNERKVDRDYASCCMPGTSIRVPRRRSRPP